MSIPVSLSVYIATASLQEKPHSHRDLQDVGEQIDLFIANKHNFNPADTSFAIFIGTNDLTVKSLPLLRDSYR